MSQPSNWPLLDGSIRLLLPPTLVTTLKEHPLAKGLYPISFGHYKQAKRHRVRRRIHTDYLLIFCYDGQGQYRVGKQKGQLQSGQILFIPKGVSHVYQADKKRPWSIYWVHFDGSLVQAYMDNLGLELLQQDEEASPVISITNWQSLLPDVHQLLQLQRQDLNVDKALLASHLLGKIFCHLPLLKSDSPQDARFDIQSLQTYMRNNSHKTLTLKEMADFCGLSRFHFSKKFAQATGASPLQFFTQMKIKQAQYLLVESEQTIAQIANSLGYTDPYYFSRMFKKQTGLSPTHYKQQYIL